MNWYGTNASPCRTPGTMLKKSVSPSGERTFIFVFYRASLWLRQFLWGDHTSEVSAISSLCVWSQIPWRNLQIRVSPRGFLHELLLRFDGLSESVMLWICFSENHFDSKNFLNFWFNTVELQSIINLSRHGSKGYATVEVLAIPMAPFLGKGWMQLFVHLSIVLWLYMALRYWSSKSSNFLVFHTSGGII